MGAGGSGHERIGRLNRSPLPSPLSLVAARPVRRFPIGRQEAQPIEERYRPSALVLT